MLRSSANIFNYMLLLRAIRRRSWMESTALPASEARRFVIRTFLGPVDTVIDPVLLHFSKAMRGVPSHFLRIRFSRICFLERAVFIMFCASHLRRPWRRSCSSRRFMDSMDLAMRARRRSMLGDDLLPMAKSLGGRVASPWPTSSTCKVLLEVLLASVRVPSL